MEENQMFIKGWMNKQYIVYTYNEILFSIKKEILTYAVAWLNLESIILCEIRQSQKDSYFLIPLT